MNFNRIFLGGNLTRDPQLSYTPNQTPIVDFGMAVNRKWKSQGGEEHEEVLFVDCVSFGKTAENINKYFSKGQAIFIEGQLKFEQWTAQDGTKRSKHKVNVQSFQFIGDKQDKPDTGRTQTQEEDIPF